MMVKAVDRVTDRALAVHGSAGASDLVAGREQAMQQRRANQQTHRHDQIWTKDPHGGPYRKASAGPAKRPFTRTSGSWPVRGYEVCSGDIPFYLTGRQS